MAPSSLRRALYATAVSAALMAAIASADEVDVDPAVAVPPSDVVGAADSGDDATIDIRPPDAPPAERRRKTIRRKKQKAPLTQTFDNFQQTYGADGEVVTSHSGEGDADENSKKKQQHVGVATSDETNDENDEDEYEEVEVEVDEDGNEIAPEGRPAHHVPPFDQEAHDRRNREHQEMADRHHAQLTAEMEVRRAEFEKRHAEHMAHINTHIMGRHRERMAEHTARLTASLAAPHSRSFNPPSLSASRSHPHPDASAEEGAAGEVVGATGAANAPGYLGGDIEAHIKAMHEEIRRHTEEHRARVHAEMERVHHEIRQMSASFRGGAEDAPSASASASNAIEGERSTVEDVEA